MASTEVVIGVAVILLALFLAWSARVKVAGIGRRIMFLPYMEPIFPVVLLGLVMTGAVLIAIGLGIPLGPRGAVAS